MGHSTGIGGGNRLVECPVCKADIDDELVDINSQGTMVQVWCDECVTLYVHDLSPENWRKKYPTGENE